MTPSLYVGRIHHERTIPRKHSFSYPFFMWFLNLDKLNDVKSVGGWFSITRFALSHFKRSDYYGDPKVELCQAIKARMRELTGKSVEGVVCGLLNLRTLGLYFSPVNFYYGYDLQGGLTHFLAEVSNTPWNERHQYAHYLPEKGYTPEHPKAFHVSPFNHLDQRYRWKIMPPGKTLSIQINVDDERGHVFTARLDLERRPLDFSNIRRELLKKPAMTLYILSAIYWQALRIYLKGIPYVPYTKETV